MTTDILSDRRYRTFVTDRQRPTLALVPAIAIAFLFSLPGAVSAQILSAALAHDALEEPNASELAGARDSEDGKHIRVAANPNWMSRTVTSNSMSRGRDRPTLQEGWIDGTIVTLVFDMELEEDLSDTPTRPDFYFKMVINSAPETCPIIGGVVIDGNTITLTFETGAEAGDEVWLEYDNFSIDAPIESVTGENGQDFRVLLDNRTGQTPATRPGRPNNLQADPDDGLVVLDWEAPTNTGGTETLRYEWRRGTSGSWNAVGTATTATDTGLDNGTTYTFYVRAVNSAGEGSAASVTGRPAGRPGPPRDLRVEPGNQQVRIRWSPPANNGGSPIRKYEWKRGSGGTWMSTGTTTTDLATNLINDTRYTFYVRAWNDSGEGPEVSINGTPSQSVFEPSAPTNLEAQPGNRRVVLTWDAPENNGGANINRYEWSEGTTDSWTSTGLTRRATISSLDNGTPYTFHVRARNSVGEGQAATATATPATAPGAPQSLEADPDDRQVTLTWDPADDGGSGLIRYEWSQNSSGPWTDNGLSRNVTVGSLENGRRYTFYVRAVNPVDEGPAANVRTTPATAPGAPENLMVVPGNEQVMLSWSQPTSNGGSSIVRYEWSQDQASWTPVGLNRSVTVGSLNNGTLYTFYVRAVNGVREGPAADVQARPSATATVPGPPRNLKAQAGDEQITLTWDPPGSNGGANITRYEWSQDPDNWPTNQTTTTRTVTVTNLNNGTPYTFYVRARNSEGPGDPASVTSTPAEPTAPGAPTNFRASPGNARATLSWSPPASNGGSGIIEYQWSQDQVTWNVVNAATRRVTATGLNNDATYTFYVRARNSVDVGPAATTPATPTASGGTGGSGSTGGGGGTGGGGTGGGGGGGRGGGGGGVPQASVPGPPTNLAASPGDGQLDLSWSPPTDDGGSAITGYLIEVSKDGGRSWRALANTESTVTTFEHTGLDPQTTRHYRVYAINSIGTGPPSNVASTTTVATPPGAPGRLVAEAVDSSRIDLSWSAPRDDGGDMIAGYQIQFSADQGLSWSVLVVNTGSTETTYSDVDLAPGTTRYYRVLAINSVGPGTPSNVASATTDAVLPGAPLVLDATAIGTSRIDLSWNPPDFDGGSPMIGYRIEVFSDGGTTWSVLRTIPYSTNATFAHEWLRPGTTRHYRVSAINMVGVGPPSNVASATTDAVPGPPRDLTAKAQGEDRIDLSWSPPDFDGGVPISGYRIDVSNNRGRTWSVLKANTGSTETTYSDEDLAPGTTRHYRVRAINSVGPGTPSDVASATTDAILPGAPLTLNATANGISRIDLSWSPPDFDGGAPITGYQIEVSSDGGTTWSVLRESTGSTVTSYAHQMLPPGATRQYRVSAINRVGVGPVSNVASATTDATTPDAPQSLAAVASGTSRIDLAWSTPTSDGGSPVIGYRIDVASSPDGGWTMLVANTGSTTAEYSHGNLDPATRRYYRVLAINAEGTGPPSNVAGATTDATVPDAPTNLGAMATSTTRIDLTWNAPAYDGGAAVTGYEIEASDDGQSGWTALATSMAARYADLVMPGTTRHYRVRAVNAVGAGPPSGVASATTDDPKERANQLNLNILPYAAAAMTASTVLAITDRVEGAATRDVQGPQTNLGGFSSLAGVVGAAARGLAPDSRPFAGAGAFSSAASPAASIFSAAARPLGSAAGAGHPERDPAQDGTGGRGASAIRLGALAGLGGLDLRQSLGGTSFLMPLGTVGDGAPQETGTSRTMAWGVGDYRVLDGPVGRGDTDWDGDVLSLHVGADTRVRPDLLTGVALSRSTSAFEFSNRTGPSVVTGDYEADVTSVHPYAAWFAGERSLAVWTTVGYGGGGVSIEESTGDMRSGDTRFLSAAAGGSAIVLSAGAASLRAKSEAWMTRVDVEENSQMDALDVDMRRARLAVEGKRAFSFDSGDELSLALETGLRYDGGDGAKSGALELGGGVRYARPSLGLVAEGRGRIMATRQDGYREWGFSGRIQIDPQTLGEGLALRLVPSWGDASGGVQRLWDHGAMGAVGNGFLGRDRQGSLNAEIEYGLRSFAGTPYGSFRLAERGTRTFNTGVRYQADMRGSLYLEASRREGASGPATQALIFRGQWRLR